MCRCTLQHRAKDEEVCLWSDFCGRYNSISEVSLVSWRSIWGGGGWRLCRWSCWQKSFSCDANASSSKIQNMLSIWFVASGGNSVLWFRISIWHHLCARLRATGGENAKLDETQSQHSSSCERGFQTSLRHVGPALRKDENMARHRSLEEKSSQQGFLEEMMSRLNAGRQGGWKMCRKKTRCWEW